MRKKQKQTQMMKRIINQRQNQNHNQHPELSQNPNQNQNQKQNQNQNQNQKIKHEQNLRNNQAVLVYDWQINKPPKSQKDKKDQKGQKDHLLAKLCSKWQYHNDQLRQHHDKLRQSKANAGKAAKEKPARTNPIKVRENLARENQTKENTARKNFAKAKTAKMTTLAAMIFVGNIALQLVHPLSVFAADYNFTTDDSRDFYTVTSLSQITGDYLVTDNGSIVPTGGIVINKVSYPNITAPTNASINYPNYSAPGVPSLEEIALLSTASAGSMAAAGGNGNIVGSTVKVTTYNSGQANGTIGGAISNTSSVNDSSLANSNNAASGSWYFPESWQDSTSTGITNSYSNRYTTVSDVIRSDGTIGRLSIDRIGLDVKVYSDESDSSMRYGVGHFDNTSCWNGNVGILGHNRGVNTYFGKLKQLEPGDKITYTTDLGTRTYQVTYTGRISVNDFSMLEQTGDNRLTLITCVENKPELRYCVQAEEW